MRFLQNLFIKVYDPTIEDTYSKIITVGNEEIQTQIIDSAGTEQFSAMRGLYFKDGHCFLLVYSITCPSSFNEIKQLYHEIIRAKGTVNVPIFIVGNKCDLQDQRLISESQGLDLSNKFNCGWKETSAKNIINIHEPFIELVRQISLSHKSITRPIKHCILLYSIVRLTPYVLFLQNKTIIFLIRNSILIIGQIQPDQARVKIFKSLSEMLVDFFHSVISQCNT